MGAERSAIAAWVASWDDRERSSALEGLAEKSRTLRAVLGKDCTAGEAEILAGAVFLEYAERVGVCPLELHWILGDAAAASADAVFGVRVQMMIEDAAQRRAGRKAKVGQQRAPRAAGVGRPCSGRTAGARRPPREDARPGEAPSRGTPTR